MTDNEIRAALAEIIRSHVEHDPPPHDLGGGVVISSLAGMIADRLGRDNPDFGRERFYKECGFKLTQKGWTLP